jgi:hypothetical protein
LKAVVGDAPGSLATSPYPDGVLFINLYSHKGAAEPVWTEIATKLRGPGFQKDAAPSQRASMACFGRNILVVFEGGEEADGNDGRAQIKELLAVLSPQNRWLLLTRNPAQSLLPAHETITFEELNPTDSESLFRSLTAELSNMGDDLVRQAMDLLCGHPLAITWASSTLRDRVDTPARLVREWQQAKLPSLNEPGNEQHTLQWLFDRSVQRLGDDAKLALQAAGMLSHSPFPTIAIDAVLGRPGRQSLRTLARRSVLSFVNVKAADEAVASDDDSWQFQHVLAYQFARKLPPSPEALRRIAEWLAGYWRTELWPTSSGRATASSKVGGTLAHAVALLDLDGDQILWETLAKPALYEFLGRLLEVSTLSAAQTLVRGVQGWMDGFPPERADQPFWLRERFVILIWQANVRKAQGDLSGALGSYSESLELSRRLAAADPGNAGWQRDLSVSLDNVGNVRKEQGDLSGALASYSESLELSRRLAAADPGNAGWQRDLTVSLGNVARCLWEQGRASDASALAAQAVAISERLHGLDATNAVWARDLRYFRSLAESVARMEP